MTTRTLPTRDVTLTDGRRLYYQQDYTRAGAAANQPHSFYKTKRAGGLIVLITIDTLPERGEHYHVSVSYPDHTPTPDEVLSVLKALLPGGGQFGALPPERNPNSLHGHVVHVNEETPTYRAYRKRMGDDTPSEVYIESQANSTPTAPEDTEYTDTQHAARLQMIRDDLGLVPPFTVAELREVLDQVRAKRGLPPGALPQYPCTERQGQAIVVPYPSNLSRAEQEHAQWHGIAHVALEHQQLAVGIYSAEQEREAEAWAGEMMVYSICGDAEGTTSAG